MFLYKSEDEEEYRRDRQRVMMEIVVARSLAHHEDIMQAYGLPSDYFSDLSLTGDRKTGEYLRPEPAARARRHKVVHSGSTGGSLLRGDRI